MNKILVAVVALVAIVVAAVVLYRPEAPAPQIIEADDSTQRSTRSGQIVGFIDRFDSQAWLGIPFARPPSGELRWMAPREPEPWDGVKQTLRVSEPCPQIGGILSGATAEENGKPHGTEDCLYLNIWAPRVAQKLPVMVWIHGGGNSIGYGGSPSYSGAHLATRHDLIVVSINYRLGPFGWFAHPALRNANNSAEDNSGNFGTLDIIAALRWVNSNIEQFGGDADNVTIFGESAGGVDVLTMMASPLAKGLYHKAIVQSGGLFLGDMAEAENYHTDIPAGDEYSSREVVNQLLMTNARAGDAVAARSLQEDMPEKDIAAFLRSRSIAEILGVYKSGAGSMLQMPLVFADGYVLPENMTTADVFSDRSNYNVTPVLIGTNRDEIKLFAMMGDDRVKRLFGIPWSIDDETGYDRDSRYGSDSWKVRGVDDIATTLTSAQADGVYAYRFDWDEEKSLFGFDMAKALGAAHGFEIAFVFGNFDRAFGLDLYEEEGIEARDKLSSSMMSYWAEFAYTGNPGRGRDGAEVAWTPWRNDAGDVDRLMIFDTIRDQGIRMSPLRLDMDMIRERFLADTSYASQEDYCSAYKMIFRAADFDQAEYDSLGQGGCK